MGFNSGFKGLNHNYLSINNKGMEKNFQKENLVISTTSKHTKGVKCLADGDNIEINK